MPAGRVEPNDVDIGRGVFAPCEVAECPIQLRRCGAPRRYPTLKGFPASHPEGISGAVAFYRRGTPDLGDFEEAEIKTPG